MSHTNTVLPLVLSPSWNFDGNDGNWSSFEITIGTPGQTFRILPSTSSSEIWVPLPQGCQGILSGVSNCGTQRGVEDINGTSSQGFQTNASSTWDQIGIYQLAAEKNLYGDDDVGLYGLETIALDLRTDVEGNDTATISSQVVAGYSSSDFWLGSIGLATAQANFTAEDENLASLLASLSSQNLTTSLSFGYSAGASYASPADYGSLVLGGYDSSRIESENLTIALGGDVNQTLRTSIQNIVAENTNDGTVSLFREESSIITTIDSTTSQLWLPQTVCDLFEETFGLTYDDVTGLYLVNDSAHSQLLQTNPSITFTMGPDTSDTGTDNVNIVLPYAAFDLQAGIPFYNSSTNYFPIRVAANESQYTLGRAFLQEAYLFVDWERQNFTIGQAVHQNSTKNVVPILSPASRRDHAGSDGLSRGAIVGIAIGACVAVVIITAAALFFVLRSRRRERADQRAHEAEGAAFINEKDGGDVHEADGSRAFPEEIMSEQRHELPEEEKRQEIMSTPVAEMPGQQVSSELEDSSERLDKKENPNRSEVFELP